MARMTVPNLAGTLVLLMVLAALAPMFQTAINELTGKLGSLSSSMVMLIVPMLVLAIIANVWETPER